MSKSSTENLKAGFWALWYRFRFYTDLPLVARILKYQKLRQKYYERFWTEVAGTVGAEVNFDKFGFAQITKDGLTTFVKQYQLMLDDPIMLDVIGNKALTYQLLSRLQAPIVPHLTFQIQDAGNAHQFLKEHTPVVVKPSSGTGGGRGVTTGISTVSQFKSAARLAARFDRNVIVEQQIEGDSYRLLYLGGKFIDAIRRDPPVVIGDAVSSIGQLIKQENQHREEQLPTSALSPLVIDGDMHNWLATTGMTLKTVPDKDQIVQVKLASNENNQLQNVNVTRHVSPEIISGCRELVDQLGVQFAGVDLICKDIAGPFVVDNCYIGEINTTPGLHHHYLIANPEEGNPVAEMALEHLYSNNIGVLRLDKSGIAVAGASADARNSGTGKTMKSKC